MILGLKAFRLHMSNRSGLFNISRGVLLLGSLIGGVRVVLRVEEGLMWVGGGVISVVLGLLLISVVGWGARLKSAALSKSVVSGRRVYLRVSSRAGVSGLSWSYIQSLGLW
jgi:hypothetical protein